MRLRNPDDYNYLWEAMGQVQDINKDEMRARVRFEDGDVRWVSIFDLIFLAAT